MKNLNVRNLGNIQQTLISLRKEQMRPAPEWRAGSMCGVKTKRTLALGFSVFLYIERLNWDVCNGEGKGTSARHIV